MVTPSYTERLDWHAQDLDADGHLPAAEVPIADAGAHFAATNVEDALAEIPKVRVTTTDPTTGDDSGDGYAVGSRWVNVSTPEEFVATDVTVGAAVWVSTTATGGGGGGGMTNPMTTVGDVIVGGTVTGGVAAPARLGIGGANSLLHGGTTPAYSAVVEADLSLTDITTANVSTAKHGLAPKGDGTTSKYLDASGAYSTPSGTGGAGNLTAPSAVSVDLGAANLLTRQAVVNAEDDLFNAASLDAKWLAYTGYDAVTDLTVKPGWCKITTAGAKLQAVPAGDWTLEGEFIAPPTTVAAFTTGGLILTNGTTQSTSTEARIAIGLSNGSDNTRVFFEKFVNGAFSTSFTQHTATIGGVLPWIIRIVKSGTLYTVQFGNTREGLQFFASNGSIGFTPTHFGFHGDPNTFINGFYRI